MAYSLDIAPDGGVLRVRVSGAVDHDSAAGHEADVSKVASACRANGCRGVLIDLRGVSVQVRYAARVVSLMGFGRLLPRGAKLASLGLPQALATDGFAHTFTELGGLGYRYFDDEAEAVAWLSE